VVVDSVVVEGAGSWNPPWSSGPSGFPSGERVTYLEIQEGQKRLWETGLFNDLQVLARGDPEVGSR
jgi:hypothetical protein